MEEEFCRPATITDLMNLIKSLNEKGAQYILIGGYALYAHGIHRATEDIDILVPAKREAAQPIIEALILLCHIKNQYSMLILLSNYATSLLAFTINSELR